MKKINSSNAKAKQYGHSKANSKRTRKKMDVLEKKMNVLLEKYRKKAVEEDMEKGMEKGFEQGKNHLALLVGRLLEAGRMDDLKRVSYDEAYREKLLKEFGL